jgi:2-polyprenyl-6-methoxyphenol hydroxylase-like FAD-dependent oxidoreductase
VRGKVLVIGGGIGGLATAVALRRAGWEVEVFERAPELGEVGAGLSLWRNALAALDRIGLLETLRALGVEGQTGAFRTPSGETLLAMKAGITDRASAGIILLSHRAELLDVLHRVAGPDVVRLGALVLSA